MEFTGNSFAQRMFRLAGERSSSSARATTPPPAPCAFERAIDHFAHGHWAEAYDELVPFADAGDREAARIALLMAVHGRRLFGQTFLASPAQRKRWQVVASRVHTA
jgi:hypothetical protein